MVPGQVLVDRCKGAVLEDQGSQMGVLHMDEEDQEDLVVQDTHLAVPELLFDRTLKLQFHFNVVSNRHTTIDWQAEAWLVDCLAGRSGG